MLKSLEPDVLVIDVAMSNMNGAEATRQTRRRFTRVRVVMLSTHEDNQYVIRYPDRVREKVEVDQRAQGWLPYGFAHLVASRKDRHP